MSDRISVRDVAAAAGVSVGSVSRVLNGSGYASAELRRRVLQAAEQLRYEPDFTARHLRTGRSRTIGYLLPNIANPFLAAHLSEVERLTQEAGYSLLVGSSERPARDRELVAFFENRRLEGIIASPSFEYPDKRDCPFSNTKLPTVLVDRELGPEFDAVLMDHFQGLRQAVEYLLTLGHQRIALFVSSDSLRPGREKLRGYRAALEAAGVPFDPALVYMPNSWLESSRTQMEQMLKLDLPPSALIALGTQLLSGAVHVVREAGMDIPRNFSVIGIGTMETLELMYPPVTALRYNFQRSAQVAVQLMLDRIAADAPLAPRRVMVPWELVMGASCGPCRVP